MTYIIFGGGTAIRLEHAQKVYIPLTFFTAYHGSRCYQPIAHDLAQAHTWDANRAE